MQTLSSWELPNLPFFQGPANANSLIHTKILTASGRHYLLHVLDGETKQEGLNVVCKHPLALLYVCHTLALPSLTLNKSGVLIYNQNFITQPM